MQIQGHREATDRHREQLAKRIRVLSTKNAFGAVVPMTPEEVISLISARVPEGPRIEFKRELPGNSDSDKKEFLADVIAFANAAGGTILYGIDEAEGSASDITGITYSDRDEVLRRLSSLIRDGIQPRLSGFSVSVISVQSREVLELSVRQSHARPHWVAFKGTNRFYLRHATEKEPMTIDEVRDAFLQSCAAIDRVSAWRAKRVAELLHVPTRRIISVILHIAPLSSASSYNGPRLSPADPNVRRVSTILYETANTRVNHLGAITTSSLGEDRNYDYVQLYRDFRIEAVFEGGVDPDGRAGLIATEMEDRVNTWLERMKPWFVDIDFPFPAVVFLSITSNKLSTLMEGLRPSTSAELTVCFDPTAIEEAEFLPDLTMRPVYDHVWQTYGVPNCPNYDESGRWQKRGWR